MEAHVYNTTGKKTGSVKLPESVFGVAWNDSLMHQVVTSMQANARPRVAHVKTRGDVRGGGKKPWQQKGTGRARHGSIRSPIWRGGGITHGPRAEKSYARRIPKAMRAKALCMALSRKLQDKEVILVDSLGMKEPKTAKAKKTLTALAGVKGFERMLAKKNAALIATSERSGPVEKSFRNIGSVSVDTVANLNPVAILKYKYVVIENPESSLASLASRAKRKKAKVTKK